MPSTISAGLYLKSVQTCDKSKDARSSTLLLRLLGWKMRLLSGSIIFWGQSWTQLHSRKIVDESLGIELHSILRQTIILYKVSSSMDLERILTKDISPESFKDSSVDSTRHYFGPTRKIYVHSGTSKRIFHSRGSYVHLRQPTSKGSCMRKPVNRIP